MRQYKFKVPAGATQPLRVVLCWTDVPGKFLHNNLQLYLEGPSGKSWVGNAEFAFHRDPFGADALANQGVPPGAQLGGLEFDKYNNVELLHINAPAAGDYRLSVIAQYTDPDEKAQGYAVCVSGELVANSFAQLEAMIPYFRDPGSSRVAVQSHSAHGGSCDPTRREVCASRCPR